MQSERKKKWRLNISFKIKKDKIAQLKFGGAILHN